MIYLKGEVEGKQVKVDAYDDEFYTTCPICGKEVNLDEEQLKHSIGSFPCTQWYCRECSKKRAEQPKRTEKFCPNCNKIFKTKNTYCSICETRLSNNVDEKRPTGSEKMIEGLLNDSDLK